MQNVDEILEEAVRTAEHAMECVKEIQQKLQQIADDLKCVASKEDMQGLKQEIMYMKKGEV